MYNIVIYNFTIKTLKLRHVFDSLKLKLQIILIPCTVHSLLFVIQPTKAQL